MVIVSIFHQVAQEPKRRTKNMTTHTTTPFFMEGNNLKLICTNDSKRHHDYVEALYKAIIEGFGDKDLTIYYNTDAGKTPKIKDNEFFISFYNMPNRELDILFRNITIDYLNFNGLGWEELILNGGQRSIAYMRAEDLDKIPNDYIRYEDEEGRLFALQHHNKLWIFLNIIARDNYALHDFFGVLHDLKPDLFNVSTPKLTAVEDKKKMEELKRKRLILKFIEDRQRNAKYMLQTERNRLSDYQQQYLSQLQKFHTTKELYEPIITKWEKFDYKKTVEKIEKLPFVKSLIFGYESLTVKTKQLSLDCLNFGSFDIEIKRSSSDNQPFIFYDYQDQISHPYDYYHSNLASRDKKGYFCFGGYSETIVSAYRKLNFEQIILTCLKLLLNYRTSTRMHYIEPFLNKRNDKKLNSILKKLAKEQDLNLRGFDKFTISSILDGKLKFVAVKHKKDAFGYINEDKREEVEIKKCLTLKF